jgi:hypothetical protein
MKHLVKFNESITDEDTNILVTDIIDDTETNLTYLLDEDFDFVAHRFYDNNRIYTDKRDVYFNCIKLIVGCVKPTLHGGSKRIPTHTDNNHLGYTLLNPNSGEIAQGNWGVGRNSNHIEASQWVDVKDVLITYIDRMRKKYNLVSIEFESENWSKDFRVENNKRLDWTTKRRPNYKFSNSAAPLDIIDDNIINLLYSSNFSFDTMTLVFTI